MPRNVLDTVRADFDPKLERCVVSVDAKLNDGLKVSELKETACKKCVVGEDQASN